MQTPVCKLLEEQEVLWAWLQRDLGIALFLLRVTKVSGVS